MTYRGLSAIIFAAIVFLEIITYTQKPTPYTTVANGEKKGFFSGYNTVVDYNAQKNSNQKFMIVIGATVILGGVVTFALPNSKIKK